MGFYLKVTELAGLAGHHEFDQGSAKQANDKGHAGGWGWDRSARIRNPNETSCGFEMIRTPYFSIISWKMDCLKIGLTLRTSALWDCNWSTKGKKWLDEMGGWVVKVDWARQSEEVQRWSHVYFELVRIAVFFGCTMISDGISDVESWNPGRHAAQKN